VEKLPQAFVPKKSNLIDLTPTGIPELDFLIRGFQRSGITEIYGPASSGRTTIALSFLAQMTCNQEACAVVDVSDCLDPDSLVAAGVDLNQLLWIRCCDKEGDSKSEHIWKRLEQVLKVTDLLLHQGGFGAVLMDLGDVPAENARRIPLTSWFRFRQAIENTPTTLVLITREPCARTCASLALRCQHCNARWVQAGVCRGDSVILTLDGLKVEVEVMRRRAQPSPFTMRENRLAIPNLAHWETRMIWSN
jgi:hypothetical protein